jgi:hypothetical protein
MIRISLVALIVFVFVGCSTAPQHPADPDPYWGPGVVDVDELHQKLESIVGYADRRQGVILNDEDAQRARGLASAMTWEQAAMVYRAASDTLKSVIHNELLMGQQQRFRGLTRGQVIALIGMPDGRDEGEHADELIYTGEGDVSDSMSGILFDFGPDGLFRYYRYAN